VTLWVITGRYNPLLQDFIYPFGFWSPWKMLANLGGIAVLVGCVSMIWDRLAHRENAGNSTYFDWVFLGTLSIVVLTGFFTEVLHYLRMVPHRHVVYFVHLVFVFALLMYLPYSKFAHWIYRTVALVYAASRGRVVAPRASGEVRATRSREETTPALQGAGALRGTGARSL
jgi:quinone-modifying oxidoreductase, subunit QmoC